MRLMLSAAVLTLVACLPQPVTYSAASQQEAMAQAMGKPSHPPTTAEQWSAAETDAKQSASAADQLESFEAPVRLTVQGMNAEHRFKVQGGKCYAAGLGWAFGAETMASVYFQARPDGQPVNDSVGGANGRLKPHTGVLTFCADRDGEAVLYVSALKPDGSAAMNELLEYAVVIGSRTETAAAAAQRRQVDAERGATAKARIEQNIADAKARDAANLARRCRECRENFRLCQVQSAAARQYPQRGVTVSTSCEAQFGVCATGKYSGTAEEMQQCGEPPR